MSKIIEKAVLDEERALYASNNVILREVRFEGPADGESALKESADVTAENCLFNLRYPLWHVKKLRMRGCTLTSDCRAALWYSTDVKIKNSLLHGIKAVRECEVVNLVNCHILSPEFGWMSKNVAIEGGEIESEYLLLRAQNVHLDGVKFKGKYSFQYVEGGDLKNCVLDTKDAFWHSKNITVRDSIVRGEYLGWYSENLTFINCRISGTQPLCYCKGLKLVNCTMEGCDLAFEKSEADAVVLSRIDSVKNLYAGRVVAKEIGEVIRDDPNAKGLATALRIYTSR